MEEPKRKIQNDDGMVFTNAVEALEAILQLV
jgi:hypothetical protein